MMMFQTFTTLAALVLFASNAALAAPQIPGVTRQVQVTRGFLHPEGVSAHGENLSREVAREPQSPGVI